MTTDPKATPATDEEIAGMLEHANEHCPKGDEFCDSFGCSTVRSFAARIEADRQKIATLEQDNDKLREERDAAEGLLSRLNDTRGLWDNNNWKDAREIIEKMRRRRREEKGGE